MGLSKDFHKQILDKIEHLEGSIKELEGQIKKRKKQELLKLLGLFHVEEKILSYVNGHGITYKEIEKVNIYDELSDEEYEELLGYAVKIHELEEKLNALQKEFTTLEKNKK